MDSKRRCTIVSAHGNHVSAESALADDIPEWMLLEVLMRLPLKMVFQCKTVSKQWCSMISCPFFVRTYVENRISLNSLDWILVSSYANKVITKQFFQKKLALDGCPLGMIDSLDLLLLPDDHFSGFENLLVGVSNGLFLYGPRLERAWRHHTYIYEICNPITGQRIILPASARCFEFVSTGFVTKVEGNVVQSFRVVRVDVHHADSGIVSFDVYSSETRRWKYLSVDTLVYFYRWKQPVVVSKKTTLHWMITKHRVMAFDPYDNTRSVRLFRLPTHDVASYGHIKIQQELDNVLFDEHQGRLRYVEVKLDPQQPWTDLSVWILNDYDSATWCLQHRVHIDGLSTRAVPLSFHPFVPDVIYLKKHKAVLSYDVRTGELKVVDDSRRCYVYQLPYCLQYFSFLIPPWPVFIHPRLISVK